MSDSGIRDLVVISIDSLRWDYLVSGKTTTPNVDQFRQGGVYFNSVITPAPFTIPSHASMFSGLLPYNHGIRDQRGTFAELKTNHSLFRILSNQGYDVASLDSSPILENRGFGWNHAGSANKRKMKNVISDFDNPFFLFIHFWEAHTPYYADITEKRLRDKLVNQIGLRNPDVERNRLQQSAYDRTRRYRIERIRDFVQDGHDAIIDKVKRGYISGIERIDEKIGHLRNTLADESRLENTLIVITSDHGESFNEHNEIDQQSERRYEHGHFLYENLVRIPAIFSHPELPSSDVSVQVSTTDYVPTILDTLNITSNVEFDGISLIPHIMDQGRYKRKTTYSEVVREDGSVPEHLRTVRSNKYKIIHDYEREEKYLYNIREDPREKINLYETKRAIREDLQSILEEHLVNDDQKQNAEVISDEERDEIYNHLSSLGYT